MLATLFAVLALFVALLLMLFAKRAADPSDVPKRPVRRAYVFGVNYGGEDEGCWKDVADYADALRASGAFEDNEVFNYVNDRTEGKHFTSKIGMQKLLSNIAARSHRDDVRLVHIHFCGRGTSAGIETSDGGVIDPTWITTWATSFSPGTRVVGTFDCGVLDCGVEDAMLAGVGDRAGVVSGDGTKRAFLGAVHRSDGV